MTFVTKNTVTDIIVVRNLHIVKKNHIFQFSAVSHNTVSANQRAPADKSSGAYFCFMSDDCRCTDIVVRIDFGVPGNPDIFTDLFKLILRQGFTQFDNEFLDFPKSFPGIFCVFQNSRRPRVCQVIKIFCFQHYFFTSIRCPLSFIDSII